MKHISNRIYILSECPYAWLFISILNFAKTLHIQGYDIFFIFPATANNRYWESQRENEKKLSEIWTILHIPLEKRYSRIIIETFLFKEFIKKLDIKILVSFGSYAWKISRLLFLFWFIDNVYHSINCNELQRMSLGYRFIEILFNYFLMHQVTKYLACWPSEAFYITNSLKWLQNGKLLFTPNFIIPEYNKDIIKANIGCEKDIDYIYVWRILKHKWVRLILETFKQLNLEDKIIYLWDGPDLENLKKDFPNAKLLGRVWHHAVLNYMSRSTYFVSASKMEWLSYSLLEAMSFGLIPIVSNVEWHRDMIIDWYNWFLFQDGLDLINLIFKIQLLSTDSTRGMSLNAIESVSTLGKIGYNSLCNIFPKP